MKKLLIISLMALLGAKPSFCMYGGYPRFAYEWFNPFLNISYEPDNKDGLNLCIYGKRKPHYMQLLDPIYRLSYTQDGDDEPTPEPEPRPYLLTRYPFGWTDPMGTGATSTGPWRVPDVKVL